MKRSAVLMGLPRFLLAITMGACVALPALAGTRITAPATLMNKLVWRSVGPYIGGRVVAVAGVPGNANLFYMGAVDGGIWKSTDYGIRWTNISDGALPGASASIGALAVAPSDSKILYAGTGESDIRGDVVTGDGVFRSNDAGKTWHYDGLRQTHTISAIVVDPRNPNVVYASSMGHVFKSNARRGVFKSINGGKTWRKVLFVNDRTGAIDLVMDPKNPAVLYASMWQAYRTPWKLSSGGPGSGLYKTTDGGAHWIDLSRNSGLPRGVLGRMGVAVAANNPQVVYAIIQAQGGGVFRSDDGGTHWRRVNAEWKLRQRAFYYMNIYVDPKNTDTVYIPEVDALWVSHDGGHTFHKLHTPHGDNHIVWINPHNPGILLEGNDGGATVSTDGGLTWSTEHNQPTGQFYHVNLDSQFPFHIYGAQQDEGSFEGPSAAPGGMISLSDWHRVAYGESTVVAPQPDNPAITYGSGYFSIFLRYDMTTGQYQEISPWPDYQEGAASEELKYRFPWTHPILFSPANPTELLIGAQYVLKSTNHGRTWQRISPDLTRNDPVTEAPTGGPVDLDQSGAEIYPGLSALAVSPLDGALIWAGSDDGLVHITIDGGRHWTQLAVPGLPAWSEITSIEPSHVARGTAYLTASRYMWDDFHPYVYKTTDYGRRWTAITAGLPSNQYVFAVRQDPKNADLLFLGTRSSVYVSLDNGSQWLPLTLNLPVVQVRDIAINTRQGDVAIATHGRSFWVLDNLSLLEQLTRHRAIGADDVHVFAPERAWLSHSYGQSSYAQLVPAVGENPPFGATVFFQIPANYDGHTPVTLTFANAGGQIVRRFHLHLKTAMPPLPYIASAAQKKHDQDVKLTAVTPGINRFQWNLRYPDATEVDGFNPPIAAGGLDDTVAGPVVVPGRYDVVLDYGGQHHTQMFDVTLDPRLHASPAALAARLVLALRIHTALNTLDSTINQAMLVRNHLRMAVRQHRLTVNAADAAISGLDRAIDSLVQMAIKSSEGSLVHETKLRSHLAYLAADINLAYARPTAAQYAVFRYLNQKAIHGEQQLESAMARGRTLL